MPRTTVIVINFRRNKTISECLKALANQTCLDFDLLVVDNESDRSSVCQIEEIIRTFGLESISKLVTVDKNLGFAGGNLVGLKYTTSQYVALLNNDTIADPQWLSELMRVMNNRIDTGICASRLLVHDSDIIDSAGDEFSTNLKGFKRGEGLPANQYAAEEYIFGACAGAALYRRKMLDEIGFFDEDFFLIYEDTDLNLRAQLAGWKVLYVPTALVQHKVRSSIGELSDIAIYYSVRNCELVRMKNVPLLVFLRCLPWFLLGEIMDLAYFSLKLKKSGLYCRAKLDAIRLFPVMLKKRRNIMKKRKVPNKYLMSMLTPVWRKEFVNSKIKKLLCN